MRKLVQILVLWISLGIVLSGCVVLSKPISTAEALPKSIPTLSPTPSLIAVVDGLGRKVTLAQPAQAIVSLAPSVSEILYAIGAGSQVVGRDSFSNFPVAVKEVQDVGGSMGNYSLEMIAQLNPDLVLAAEINTPEQVNALEELGLTVYYISNPKDLEGLYPILEKIGLLTGHAPEALSLVDSLKGRVDKVTKIISQINSRPLVFYELDGTEPAKPWTSGPGTYLDQLIQMAGGVNLGASMTEAWAQISLEEILVQDPNLILLGDSIYGMTPEQVSARPGWEKLTAIQQDRILAFNDDLVSRPGPRLVDGLEELAKLIHPELFN
ncbi:MAG: cobalamin-binding protein [Chloroflexi bacterium]|nr:cobalamin-binding protein [Chloroflexota bacterium]